MNWMLEVVVVPVSDVDRAKAFYAEQLGFNGDHDTKVSEGNASSRSLLQGPAARSSWVRASSRAAATGLAQGLAARRVGHPGRAFSAGRARGGGQRDPGHGRESNSTARCARQRRVRVRQRSGRKRLGGAADIRPRLRRDEAAAAAPAARLRRCLDSLSRAPAAGQQSRSDTSPRSGRTRPGRAGLEAVAGHPG
jgi:catechol 2,3-dioxygenase-like lactoylglutathione lyase family enzyme